MDLSLIFLNQYITYMKIPEKFIWAAFIVTAVILFTFGFSQKGYVSENNTSWIEGVGLHFEDHSFVYTQHDTGEKKIDAFTLKIIITLKKQEKPYFARILTLFPLNKSDEQFLIGQWDNSIVIMNGTDYSNNRKEQKIYLPVNIEGTPISISVHVSPAGTDVFINQTLIHRFHSYGFIIPPHSILVLGEHKYKHTGWVGTFHKLSLFIESEKRVWASYDFSENSSFIIPYSSRNNILLLNPEKKPQLVLYPFKTPKITLRFILYNWKDIVLNWVGFIPFTLLLTIGLKRRAISFQIIGILTACTAICLSLIFEIFQIWIPTRESSLLDLFLNTAGGITGYVIAYKILQRHTLDLQENL